LYAAGLQYIEDTGYKIPDAGYKIPDTGKRMELLISGNVNLASCIRHPASGIRHQASK
jgi:hypothetical protein